MLLFLPLMLLTLAAYADVAMDPPEDCPDGSVGSSNHAAAWCTSWDCESDANCTEGLECSPSDLCIYTHEVPCGGMQKDTADKCTQTVHEALGPCAEDGTCAQGVCKTAPRCVSPEPPDEACGGCASAPAGWWWLVVPGYSVCVFRRRK